MAMYGPHDPYGQQGYNPPNNPQQGQPDNLGQTPYEPQQYPPVDQPGYPDQYSSPPNYDPGYAPPVFGDQPPPPGGGTPPYGPPGGPPPPGAPPPFGPQGEPPKKSNGLLWGLLAGGGALVLIILVVVFIGFFVIGSGGEETTTTGESESAEESESSSQDDPSNTATDAPTPDTSSDPFAGYADDDPIRGEVGDCVYAWSTGGSEQYDAKLVDCDDSTANAYFYEKAMGTLDQTQCPDHAGGEVEFWYWVDMPSGTSDDYVLCGYWTAEPG